MGVEGRKGRKEEESKTAVVGGMMGYPASNGGPGFDVLIPQKVVNGLKKRGFTSMYFLTAGKTGIISIEVLSFLTNTIPGLVVGRAELVHVSRVPSQGVASQGFFVCYP